MRPLYRRLATAAIERGSGNAGLWYDKLCDTWSEDWTLTTARGPNARSPKLAWIQRVTGAVGASAQLAEATARICALVAARGGHAWIFTTTSNFATGLGRSHPVENGFAWHPTLGVPYLPGSSAKGLVRAWARDGAAADPTVINRLLGEPEARAAGRMVFLDAIPIQPVELAPDVMTPHYTGWSPEDPPGDWRSPVPVPFLVVGPGAPFLFAVIARDPAAAAELAIVLTWLRDALCHAGAGAKTAVGYGRFAYDEARLDQLQRQRVTREAALRRAALEATPDGRRRLALEKLPEREVLDQIRRVLDEKSLASAAERRELALVVQQLGYVELWRAGKKRDRATSHGPDKLKRAAQLVLAAIAPPTR